MINEEYFFTGSNDGSLGVWSINKKKPMLTVKNAHKSVEKISPDIFNSNSVTNWISSVRAYYNSDLLASGSDDGFIRVWAYSNNMNSLTERFKIEIVKKSFFFTLFESSQE